MSTETAVPKVNNRKKPRITWTFLMRVDNGEKFIEFCRQNGLNGQSLYNAVGGKCRRMCRRYWYESAEKCPYKIKLDIATGEVYERNQHNHTTPEGNDNRKEKGPTTNVDDHLENGKSENVQRTDGTNAVEESKRKGSEKTEQRRGLSDQTNTLASITEKKSNLAQKRKTADKLSPLPNGANHSTPPVQKPWISDELKLARIVDQNKHTEVGDGSEDRRGEGTKSDETEAENGRIEKDAEADEGITEGDAEDGTMKREEETMKKSRQLKAQEEGEMSKNAAQTFVEPRTGKDWHFLATVAKEGSLIEYQKSFGLMKRNGTSEKKIWLKCEKKQCPYRGLYLKEKMALFDRYEHIHNPLEDGPKLARRKTGEIGTTKLHGPKLARRKTCGIGNCGKLAPPKKDLAETKTIRKRGTKSEGPKLASRKADINLRNREKKEKPQIAESKCKGGEDDFYFVLSDLEKEFTKLAQNCQLVLWRDNSHNFALAKVDQKTVAKMLLFAEEESAVTVSKCIGKTVQRTERWPKAGSEQFVHALRGICVEYFGCKIGI
ncbi:hypothetical protein niasHS_010533 [Heterodera schachtii]|uniref:Uncharacterized protein n=1 Tax=Heterodera schachtii TaxID=97005 RepID=A0ABD2ITT2_HETSC